MYCKRITQWIPYALSPLTTTSLMTETAPTGCEWGEDCSKRLEEGTKCINNHTQGYRRSTVALFRNGKNRDALGVSVSVHRWALSTLHQQTLIRSLHREHQVFQAQPLPDLTRSRVVGDKAGEVSIFTGGGGELVPPSNGETEKNEVTPNGRREVYNLQVG